VDELLLGTKFRVGVSEGPPASDTDQRSKFIMASELGPRRANAIKCRLDRKHDSRSVILLVAVLEDLGSIR
jgi:hypothetical protein